MTKEPIYNKILVCFFAGQINLDEAELSFKIPGEDSRKTLTNINVSHKKTFCKAFHNFLNTNTEHQFWLNKKLNF